MTGRLESGPPRSRSGFLEVIASGRLVRLGEAALLGHATVAADPRHLDVVFAGPPRRTPVPLGLWLFHFPGVPPLEGALEAVRAGLAAYAAAHGRTHLPQPDVLRRYPALSAPDLPDLAVVVGRLPEGYGLHCQVSFARALWPALPYVVEALEDYLCAVGSPPRLIREVRPLSGEAREEAEWNLPAVVVRRPRARKGQGQATISPGGPASEAEPAGEAHRASVARSKGGRGSSGAAREGSESPPADRWWRRLLAAVGTRARRATPPAAKGVRSPGLIRQRQRVTRPARAGVRTAGQLDLLQTVSHAASRAAGQTCRFSLKEQDLRFVIQPDRDDPDRCLLLDTSASMAGSRARALHQMADFLLRNSRGRVAVVAFSGGAARIVSGFTRSRRALREAMARLRPSGLTPLAAGLMLCLELIRTSCGRNCEVILLTDGEPTRALWSHSSERDSYVAGEAVCRAGIKLVCCGLRANERFLAELAQRGDGRLFVLRDFASGSLLALSRGLLAERT